MLIRIVLLSFLAYALTGSLLGVGVSLDVRSDDLRNIHVSLRNEGEQSYWMLIGGLCDGLGTPAFHFVLKKNGHEDEPLVLSYNSPGVICGNPDLWTVFLPRRSAYEFTFFPSELRFQHRMQQSLADFKNSYYTVEVTYSVSVAQKRRLLASHGLVDDKRWWQGKLTSSFNYRM